MSGGSTAQTKANTGLRHWLGRTGGRNGLFPHTLSAASSCRKLEPRIGKTGRSSLPSKVLLGVDLPFLPAAADLGGEHLQG